MISIFLGLFILIPSISFAQNRSNLEQKLDFIREIYVVPGMGAAIYKDGQLMELAVSGIRKVGSQELITKEDKFHLGSCTKSMTATLVATFVEEGHLRWQTTLGEVLPELGIDSNLKNVTIEMLLSHASGLSKDPDFEEMFKLSELESSLGRRILAQKYLSYPPEFNPQTFNYSNIGYIVAGYILEKISDTNWEQLMKERVFDKLDMKTCGFGPTSDPENTDPQNPWGHIFENWNILPVHADNPSFYGPSATVHCSISDWLKYLNQHLLGFKDKSSFISKKNWKKLHEIVKDESFSNYTYGGWFRIERDWANGDVLTHSGTNTFNYATAWIAPEINTILVSVANRGGPSGGVASDEVILFLIDQYLGQ